MSLDEQSQTSTPGQGDANPSGRPPPPPSSQTPDDAAAVVAALAYGEARVRTERDGTGAGAEQERASAPPGRHASFLTIACAGARQVNSAECATVAGGQRIVVTYSSGDVTGRARDEDVKGVVLNGGDWILVRNDGLVVFDAHFTIGKNEHDPDILQDIAATVRRELNREWDKTDFLVDLFLVGQARLPDQDAWEKGDIDIPFTIPVRMEAATEAPPWAKARFGDLAESAKRFSAFTGNQCLAGGKLKIQSGRVISIKFDVFPISPHHQPIADRGGA